jgi:FtsH-binding integral membrane protein
MVLVSIVVGLGITHVLSSLGSAVHRIRGHGRPLRLELNYLVWIGLMFGWLVQFWWFEFKWSELEPQVGFLLFGFLVLYVVTLFLVTVILVPHHLAVVDDTWEYFLSIRP